jgi:cell wall-associated NlpC family hydrolase
MPDVINACALGNQAAVADTPAYAAVRDEVLRGPPPMIEDTLRPPLTPDTGGRSIGVDALQVGDIVVSTTPQFKSGMIRGVTGSPVSHALVYVGDGQVVEAIGKGVALRGLSESLADDDLAVALRYPDLTLEQGARIRDYVGNQIGKPYSYTGAAKAGGFHILEEFCRGMFTEPEFSYCVAALWPIQFEPTEPNRFFCSELVVDAYASAGVPLTDQPAGEVSPGDIAALPLVDKVRYVGHLLYSPPQASRSQRATGPWEHPGLR